MKTNKLILFLFYILASLTIHQTSYADENIPPVVINPVIVEFDSFPDIPESMKLYVGDIIDSYSKDSADILGYTRTGIKKYAPVVCSPSFPDCFKKSLQQLLSQKGNLSSDASSAQHIIEVNIVELSLTENSRFLSQTIDIIMKVEVSIVDPLSSDYVRKLKIESTNTKKHMDTTKYAEEVARGVISNIINEILKSLIS
ncbi:MAG: hypothetical protein GXY77_03090 [Fibrobacter sp.]|nr:hypothetical protein [Fibrobacter sp.]